jgi:hypothetical protein
MIRFRTLNDSLFPGSFASPTDFNISLIGPGTIHSGPVTKAGSGTQFAISVGEMVTSGGSPATLTGPPSGYTLVGTPGFSRTVSGTVFTITLGAAFLSTSGATVGPGQWGSGNDNYGGGGSTAITFVISFTP